MSKDDVKFGDTFEMQTTHPLVPESRIKKANPLNLGGTEPDLEAPPRRRPADTNPKTEFGSVKPSLGLIPKVALEAAAAAHKLGADKYGPWNWRDKEVSAMVYVNAMMRHIQEWKEIEDDDPDTLKSHLGNVMACCGILLDAQDQGCLIDDRPKRKVK